MFRFRTAARPGPRRVCRPATRFPLGNGFREANAASYMVRYEGCSMRLRTLGFALKGHGLLKSNAAAHMFARSRPRGRGGGRTPYAVKELECWGLDALPCRRARRQRDGGRAMTWIAWKMLTGDRSKYVAILFGVAFACFLIAEQSAIFCGVMLRTTSQIRDIQGVDVWVMNPNVRYVDDLKAVSDDAVLQVRGVPGVAWAVNLYRGQGQAQLDNGRLPGRHPHGRRRRHPRRRPDSHAGRPPRRPAKPGRRPRGRGRLQADVAGRSRCGRARSSR